MKRNIKKMTQKGTTKIIIWRELQKSLYGGNYKKDGMTGITKKMVQGNYNKIPGRELQKF